MRSFTHTPPLDPRLAARVLDFLGVEPDEPTPALLGRLVDRYVRRVPWESAFRIAKRAVTARTVDCPRWPREFWTDAMQRGGGGTCFESNYAFFSLLRAMGFVGYLTINDMGDMCGCHTAIVVQMDPLRADGVRWLVDVGIPLYVPVPLSVRATQRRSDFHTYTIAPQGDGTYIAARDRHPRPYIFTLLDRPVTDAAYRAATTGDYESDGHFLDDVIVNKVIDDHVWRFNGRADPPLLESFGPSPTSVPMQQVDVVRLARRFGMDRDVLVQALRIVDVV